MQHVIIILLRPITFMYIIKYFIVCTLLRIVYSLYYFLYVSVSHFLDINKPVDDKQLSSES